MEKQGKKHNLLKGFVSERTNVPMGNENKAQNALIKVRHQRKGQGISDLQRTWLQKLNSQVNFMKKFCKLLLKYVINICLCIESTRVSSKLSSQWPFSKGCSKKNHKTV